MPRRFHTSGGTVDRLADVAIRQKAACGVQMPDRLTSVPITDTTAIRSTVIEVCGGGFDVGFQSRQIATGEPRRQHAENDLELGARDHQWRPEHPGVPSRGW